MGIISLEKTIKRGFSAGLVLLTTAVASADTDDGPLMCPDETALSAESAMCEEPLSPPDSIEPLPDLAPPHDFCQEVLLDHNDPDERRINIVYVGVNTTHDDLLLRALDSVDVEGITGGLLSIRPFSTNAHLFNFWYVPYSVYIGYDDIEEGSHIFKHEDDEGIRAAEKACDLPNKAVIVLPGWEFRASAYTSSLRDFNLSRMDLDALRYYQETYDLSREKCKTAINEMCRTCAEPNESSPGHVICDIQEILLANQDPILEGDICDIITEEGVSFGTSTIPWGDYSRVDVHELGHAIIGLHDEYVNRDGLRKKPAQKMKLLKRLSSDGLNCFPAKTKEVCERDAPWAGMAGCYPGCNYTFSTKNPRHTYRSRALRKLNTMHLWRSVDKGIMDDGEYETLGEWNIRRACDTLYAATGRADGDCRYYGYHKGDPVCEEPKMCGPD